MLQHLLPGNISAAGAIDYSIGQCSQLHQKLYSCSQLHQKLYSCFLWFCHSSCCTSRSRSSLPKLLLGVYVSASGTALHTTTTPCARMCAMVLAVVVVITGIVVVAMLLLAAVLLLQHTAGLNCHCYCQTSTTPSSVSDETVYYFNFRKCLEDFLSFHATLVCTCGRLGCAAIVFMVALVTIATRVNVTYLCVLLK
jgi:hypothetical protein